MSDIEYYNLYCNIIQDIIIIGLLSLLNNVYVIKYNYDIT